MQSEPLLLNLPVEEQASYLRAILTALGCTLPTVPAMPVAEWVIE